jgi:hypothetical protein
MTTTTFWPEAAKDRGIHAIAQREWIQFKMYLVRRTARMDIEPELAQEIQSARQNSAARPARVAGPVALQRKFRHNAPL